MFISEQIETHRRHLHLKHLLLLLLRIAAVILIGLALSRPLLKLGTFSNFLPPALGGIDASVAAVILIDNSLTMEYVAENKTRLEQAKELAAWILDRLPENSDIAVLNCDSEAVSFQVDKLAAAEKNSRTRTSAVARPCSDMIKNAVELLKTSQFEQRELYIISDFSESGWQQKGQESVAEQLNSVLTFLVDVSVAEPSNSAVQRVTINPESVAAKSPVRFDITVSHIGTAKTQSLELLTVNNKGEEKVRMAKTVDFPEGTSQKNLTMMLSGFEPGTYQGKIRFAAGDALSVDDQFWFSLAAETKQKFLILAQPPVREHALFLREALNASSFETEEQPVGELQGLTQEELQKYNGVFLLDPVPLPPNVWKKLADYAAEGYGVCVCLGESCDTLKFFNDPAATEVLGAKLIRQARNPDGELWLVPELSPVFAPFHSLGDHSVGLTERFSWMTQTVFRYWELGDLSLRSEIAARFSDKRPAILTQTLGRGRTVTVTTPVSETAETPHPWNLWTRNEASWMFLLLSEGIAKYIAGSSEQKFNFLLGTPIVIPLHPGITSLPTRCLLGTPDGKKSVPISPDSAHRQIAVSQGETDIPGNYFIRSGGNHPLDIGFSINIVPETTRLNKVGGDVLDNLLGANQYKAVRQTQEIENGTARKRIGSDIYVFVLLLLTGVFAAEFIFANRFYTV
ncbi:hypothetical protein FACS189419_07800 [Planctomycetales bacterium]|nr:hypothetical protein FACS189419_07800 [Planctomycetales bacterium]